MPVELICAICSKPFKVRPSRAARGAKYCSWTCHQIGEGRKGGAVIAAKMRAESKHKTYPKLNQRHMHRVVMEQKLGRPLQPGEIIHHIDGNKQNNHPGNLLLTNRSEHIRIHIYDMLKARKEKHGY